MILLDLALQGIRDLTGSMRVRLQSGYNALVAPGISPETIFLGLSHLLYLSTIEPEGRKAGEIVGSVDELVEKLKEVGAI